MFLHMLFVPFLQIPTEPDAAQLLLVGFVCTLLVAVLRFLMERFQWTPSLMVIGIISGVVSIALACVMVWQFLPPPPSGDFMEIANYVLVTASAILGFATFIYNVVLKKLLDALTKALIG